MEEGGDGDAFRGGIGVGKAVIGRVGCDFVFL
jgi:hypothetical protein